jgi:hypothetical protein
MVGGVEVGGGVMPSAVDSAAHRPAMLTPAEVSKPSRDSTLPVRSVCRPLILALVVATNAVLGLGRPWPSSAARRAARAETWVCRSGEADIGYLSVTDA